MNKSGSLLLAMSFTCSLLIAQKSISIEDFTIRDTFAEKSVGGINWMQDGKYYTALSENKVIQYDITTGMPVQTLVDGDALPTAIVIEDYSFSADETRMLLQTQRESIYRRSFTAEYFVYDRNTSALVPLSLKGRQSYATFSPDGSKVAFVRDNNLFFVTLSDMREHPVTADGEFNSIINGTTDWVYEEEFSLVVGFEWSPDSKRIAYYRFDETEVKEYSLQYWGNHLYPVDYRYKYPKAGERNAVVEVWIHDLDGGRKVKVNIGTETDIYVPRMKWTTDPHTLSVRKLNRLQNHLTLFHADAGSGEAKVMLSEKTDTYFDIEVLDDLTYLGDGKHFIITSEAGGYKHLYLYSTASGTGRVVRRLTSGDYEVSEFIGYDEKKRVCYYTSTEESPLERHFYSVTLDGGKKTRLSMEAGKHAIDMSPDFQFYIDHHSSAAHPKVVTLYRTRRNVPLKVLERNSGLIDAAKEYGIVPKAFFKFTNDEGTVLNGLMLKPADFDESKRYPVMLFQYSGPGSQQVQNAWAGGHFFFHQLLVQKGYIVAIIDPRGTGGRGEAFKKVTYKQLGRYELEDHLAGARYLSSLDYTDGERMGIWGWSYGGYMSSLALTKGAGVFKLGIAVSPVTNWRFYDTIYTERYLQTPQLNPEGYDQNSTLDLCVALKGEFPAYPWYG